MSRWAYLNGVYVAAARAVVSIEDRGFQFGDSIYEVWPVRRGLMQDREGHLARYRRGLAELRMAAPMSDAALIQVLKETIRRNRMRHGFVYLQISRGAAPRDHVFPNPPIKPTMVVTAKTLDVRAGARRALEGVAVITLRDTRWGRCDIKSVNLLPNVLAKQAAREAGAFEAWLVDEAGLITEGASTSAWIVDAEGRLRTRELSERILHGVTRAIVAEVARARQMPVLEQGFSVGEAKAAREAFITSAGNPVVPVIAVDGQAVGSGRPGPVAQALRAAYLGAEA